jgi:hypothetical protein
MEMPQYRAPWGQSVKIITLVVSMLFVAAPLVVAGLHFRILAFPKLILIVASILPLLLVFSGTKTILGYSVREGAIWVHRPFWITRVSLEGLKEVTVLSGTFRAGFRLCGSGGYWGWLGWFWNGKLGVYRLLATRLDDVVVVKAAGRPMVFSPEKPDFFAAAVREAVR